MKTKKYKSSMSEAMVTNWSARKTFKNANEHGCLVNLKTVIFLILSIYGCYPTTVKCYLDERWGKKPHPLVRFN